jgi:hypothetical protein
VRQTCSSPSQESKKGTPKITGQCSQYSIRYVSRVARVNLGNVYLTLRFLFLRPWVDVHTSVAVRGNTKFLTSRVDSYDGLMSILQGKKAIDDSLIGFVFVRLDGNLRRQVNDFSIRLAHNSRATLGEQCVTKKDEKEYRSQSLIPLLN